MKLSEISNRLLAGEASLEGNDLQFIMTQFSDRLEEAVNKDLFLSNKEQSELIGVILENLLENKLAFRFCETIDKDLYLKLGNHLLLSCRKTESAIKPSLNSLIHSYLDILSLSQFLNRIYEEKEWDKLIRDLLFESNYNLQVLFSRRAGVYANKTLFRIIRGNSVQSYTFGNVAHMVNNYAESIAFRLKIESPESGMVAF